MSLSLCLLCVSSHRHKSQSAQTLDWSGNRATVGWGPGLTFCVRADELSHAGNECKSLQKGNLSQAQRESPLRLCMHAWLGREARRERRRYRIGGMGVPHTPSAHMITQKQQDHMTSHMTCPPSAKASSFSWRSRIGDKGLLLQMFVSRCCCCSLCLDNKAPSWTVLSTVSHIRRQN